MLAWQICYYKFQAYSHRNKENYRPTQLCSSRPAVLLTGRLQSRISIFLVGKLLSNLPSNFLVYKTAQELGRWIERSTYVMKDSSHHDEHTSTRNDTRSKTYQQFVQLFPYCHCVVPATRSASLHGASVDWHWRWSQHQQVVNRSKSINICSI